MAMVRPSRPRRPSPLSTVASFVIISSLILSSSILSSTCHVFLPRTRHARPKSSMWFAPHSISTPRRHCKNKANYDDGNGNGNDVDVSMSWREIRGGAGAGSLWRTADDDDEDDSSEDLPMPVAVLANIAASSSATTSDPSSRECDDNEATQTIIDDETSHYATIGVLNVPSTDGNNFILLSYKCREGPDRWVYEKWGVTEATPTPSILSNNGCDANNLEMAEVNGCLCHGIVLNLPRRMDAFASDGAASKELDELLLCIAKGVIRRSRVTQRITFSITLGRVGGEKANDHYAESAKRYVQGYLKCALAQLWELHFGKSLRVDRTPDNESIDRHFEVILTSSDGFVLNTAMEMANEVLRQSTADEVSRSNIVPRSLFGALCTQVHRELLNSRLASDCRVDNKISTEWRKLSEKSQNIKTMEITIRGSVDGDDEAFDAEPAPKTMISTDLRQKVESAMAVAFVDAEESLLELEISMDEAFLDDDGGGDENCCPMPEFGDNVDAIVGAMSVSILIVLDEINEAVSESDRDWVEAQRMQALEQVVRMGIHRLFCLHLQNLRDHFGRRYEIALEDFLTDDLNLGKRSLWKGAGELRRREAARRVEEGFTKAAFDSIPRICRRPDGELCEELGATFGCAEALRGLLEDMHEATSTCGLEEEEWKDIMGMGEDDGSGIDSQMPPNSRVGIRQMIKNVKAKMQRRGPAKWYERLAGKAFVIGVNYVQGWLILQALRREARKRDLAMPKFPLF
eukprot:CAMPEP_0172526736 /NCGR_PEP_ID=MMETSP1067-20121228/1584_1 /TAXON_ID=265564 ORGANISM="Thalassiosira punctigera, Strain Tpunct2005C2" /NCGR_SAMPLE_ID=MMETSP1067 /ASSEMBLY_ACC=CAM_ASM_000444 /LENGTH=744 /DNA_ID=CAMNT_0013310311 /DNA_START=25 /DNA_END=2259 /DNA_ORIENTATION=+